jgi:hypothetical protein
MKMGRARPVAAGFALIAAPMLTRHPVPQRRATVWESPISNPAAKRDVIATA